FSHSKHATRGAAGKCATCHASVTQTDALHAPHPPTTACTSTSCHDGKAAFSAWGETCTRCHKDAPATKFDVARPDKPFSHTRHLPLLVFLPCSTCHAVAGSGEVGLARHVECAACHEDDFASRTPRTCGACHDATEPWRKLLPDRPSLQRSEFGASLDHAKHGSDCARC